MNEQSPYSGLSEEDLLGIKLNFLKILKGERLLSQGVPGLSSSRRIDSLAEVRIELRFVQDALDSLRPGAAPITRSFLKAV